MGSVISIVSLKGGVGKTTTAVNLSACLADSGNRTLLIDGDPQGSATTIAGIQDKHCSCSLIDALSGAVSLQDVIVSSRTPDLDVVPMLDTFRQPGLKISSEYDQQNLLKELIMDIKPSYNYLVIDTPPSVGWFSINGMAAADFLLIPLQCEYLAYASLIRLLKSIRHINESFDHRARLLGILLTMYDELEPIAVKIVNNIRNHLNTLVMETVIPKSLELKESASLGVPALLKHRHAYGVESYRQLAIETIKRISHDHMIKNITNDKLQHYDYGKYSGRK